MIRELKKEAKQFISDSGYGKGTNFSTAQVSSLMARFAANVVNRSGLLPDVSGGCLSNSPTVVKDKLETLVNEYGFKLAKYDRL